MMLLRFEHSPEIRMELTDLITCLAAANLSVGHIKAILGSINLDLNQKTLSTIFSKKYITRIKDDLPFGNNFKENIKDVLAMLKICMRR